VLQDIPSIITAAEAERAQRLQQQNKMREADGADKGVLLYLQVGSWGGGGMRRGLVGHAVLWLVGGCFYKILDSCGGIHTLYVLSSASCDVQVHDA
jgi:hypothetical protein